MPFFYHVGLLTNSSLHYLLSLLQTIGSIIMTSTSCLEQRISVITQASVAGEMNFSSNSTRGI